MKSTQTKEITELEKRQAVEILTKTRDIIRSKGKIDAVKYLKKVIYELRNPNR